MKQNVRTNYYEPRIKAHFRVPEVDLAAAMCHTPSLAAADVQDDNDTDILCYREWLTCTAIVATCRTSAI